MTEIQRSPRKFSTGSSLNMLLRPAQQTHTTILKSLGRGLGKTAVRLAPLAIAALPAVATYAFGADPHHITSLSTGNKILYEIASVGAIGTGYGILGIADKYDNNLNKSGRIPEALGLFMNVSGTALLLFGAITAITIPFQ